MRQIFSVAILIALCMAGCKDAVPVADPFVGRTTIPPPSTGAAIGRAPDLNYQPPPLAPPAVQMPSTAVAPSPTTAPLSTAAPTLASPYPSNSQTPSLGTNKTTGTTPYPYAPRPSSTQQRPAPAIPTPSAGTATSPGAAPATSPYLPPSSPYNSNNNLNNRGTSWQGTTPAINVSTTLNRTTPNSRWPHPVDDTATQATQGGQVPIVRTLQPRQHTDASNQPVDILDLPKAP